MFTLQADTGALETLHGLLEEVFACGGHARDIVLFPFDGSIDIIKNLFDRVGDFGANTIAGDERDLMQGIKDERRREC